LNPLVAFHSLKAAWRKNGPELLALFDGTLPRFVMARRPQGALGGVPVFNSHIVEAETFGADLEFLAANGYVTIGARELVDHLTGAGSLPERAVLLSFDDGPRNFYDVAFLLKQYRARAVHFIAPGLHAEDDPEGTDARPMTWPEIREIHESGLVEFQSHTFESRYVPTWPAIAPLAGCAPAIENSRRRPQALGFEEDLALSRSELEARLPGARIDQLAFPMYLGSDATVATARRLGFRACHWGLMRGRPLNRSGDSPFHIARLSDEFIRRLPGHGRLSLRDLWRERAHRVQLGRAWRRRFP
jgi:peptidoglycan/xylan/chitin deacetylase (PgdA/CDA1 family)